MEKTNAIVLAMFGTSVEQALPGLLNIRARMEHRFAGTTVSLAFTSQIIRRIWHQRSQDAQYRSDHPEIPDAIFTVRAPEEVISDLRTRGCRGIVVQPVYMSPGAEYLALDSLVTSLLEDRPGLGGALCLRLAVGRPALGVLEGSQDSEDIAAAARALAADADHARKGNAALVYMGHGSKDLSTDKVYREFREAMQRFYPDILTVVATVESSPTLEETIPLLQEHGTRNIVLKPFMVVAGDHARKDMVGPTGRGWQARLEQAGFSVEAVLGGLGEQDPFADIFVRHAAVAAAGAGIELK